MGKLHTDLYPIIESIIKEDIRNDADITFPSPDIKSRFFIYG